jgi:hypothetical protein
MNKEWNNLLKELAYYDITLINPKSCKVKTELKDGGYSHKVITCKELIRFLYSQEKELLNMLNEDIEETNEVLEFLNSANKELDEAISFELADISICAIKKLLDLFSILPNLSQDLENKINKLDIKNKIELILKSDYKKLPSCFLKYISKQKIRMDLYVRKLCLKDYLITLLIAAMRGPKELPVKIAKGVQGPWANMDLPMKERVFTWDDISESMRGRQRDKQKQRRYQMGFERYNDDPRVGEGFYWRELRNEPFLWERKLEESPYMSRTILQK